MTPWRFLVRVVQMLNAISLVTFMLLSRFNFFFCCECRSCPQFSQYYARSHGSMKHFHFLLQVREDPIFRREGNHVHVDSVLSIAQVSLSLIFSFSKCSDQGTCPCYAIFIFVSNKMQKYIFILLAAHIAMLLSFVWWSHSLWCKYPDLS